MTKIGKGSVLVAWIVVAGGLVAQAAPPESSGLDGKTFIGSMVLDGKDVPPIPDEFVFERGKVRSTSCDRYGFVAGPYTISTDGAFEATTTSPSAGIMHWKGTVAGDHLTGTILWIHSRGGGQARYTIQGTLKPVK
jgi:hypothetical protein